MVNEAIQKVRTVELEAKKIIEEAEKEAKFLKENNEEKCMKNHEETLSNTLKEAQEIKLEYQHKGEKEAESIFLDSQKEISEIKNIDGDVFNSVVDSIVERIVNSNGNS